jgi:hypothetical protein
MKRFTNLIDALHAHVQLKMDNPDTHYVILQTIEGVNQFVLTRSDKIFIPTIPVGDHACRICADLDTETVAVLKELLAPDLFARKPNG